MNHKPVLLVGHSPDAKNSPALDPTVAGSAGKRLFDMSGLSFRDYTHYCERMNTLPVGFEEMTRLEQRLRAMRHATSPEFKKRVVIFVGKGNAELYPWTLPRWGDPRENASEESVWLWVPHTSGLCRTWNDPSEKLALRQIFQSIIRNVKRAENV